MLIDKNTSGFAKWIYCGNDDLKKDEEVIASILSNLIRHILKYRKNDNWKKYKKHRQNSGMLPMDLLANLAVAAILASVGWVENPTHSLPTLKCWVSDPTYRILGLYLCF